MNIALVLSGGIGKRLGSQAPKQYRTIAGKPVIVHTLEQFQRCDGVDFTVAVAAPEWKSRILEWKEAYRLTKLRAVAPAGPDRQQSIRSGLLAAQPLVGEAPGGVIIQDAVRPLTSQELLRRLLRGLEEAPCVMPVLPVTDTTYTSHDGQWVDGLLDRTVLYAGQAPEAFHYQPYFQLYRDTPAETLSAMSGSCQLPYSRGWRVKMIPGDPDNLKITYAADLEACERKLLEREGPA